MIERNTLAMTVAVLLTGTVLAGSATAADVTGARLANADKEPGNWLMNHRTYDAQRYSPLDKINKVYSGQQAMTLTDRTKKLCPSWLGGNNYWSASYSRRTKLLYIPSASTCNESTLDPNAGRNAGGAILGGVPKYTERNESDIVVVDPFTGDVKKKLHKPYPNHSAALTTAGGPLHRIDRWITCCL
jgi:glucose dehydrogenase